MSSPEQHISTPGFPKSKTHQTANRVLMVLKVLLREIWLSEAKLIEKVEAEIEAQLPLNTLRKYIRTLRHSGFDIHRKRHNGEVWYAMHETVFHWQPDLEDLQTFETLINGLHHHYHLNRKLLLLLAPQYRFSMKPISIPGESALHYQMDNGVSMVQLMKEAIEAQRPLELQIYTAPPEEKEETTTLWVVPSQLTHINQRDALLTCRSPHSSRFFSLRLSKVWRAARVPQAWQETFWQQQHSFTLQFDEKLSRSYEPKPHENATTDENGRLRLSVQHESATVTLRRFTKYAGRACVMDNPTLESKLAAFQALQAKLYDATP